MPAAHGPSRYPGGRSEPPSGLHGRPTAAELVAAVAEFLEADVREATGGQVNFHARVAANALRIVERELLDADDSVFVPRWPAWVSPTRPSSPPRSGPAGWTGAPTSASHRLPARLVRHRLAVAHPGYEQA